MDKKVKHKLVALSSAVILSVYAAGYGHTQAAADLLASSEQGPSVVQSMPNPTPVPFAPPLRSSRFRGREAPPTVVVPQQTGPLSDGTYSGMGTSRYGNVEVSVTIKSGKIANVAITRCTTSYPESLIDPLPAEVVTRQSAQVDLVSGATYSARAFQTAVLQALQQAQKS